MAQIRAWPGRARSIILRRPRIAPGPSRDGCMHRRLVRLGSKHQPRRGSLEGRVCRKAVGRPCVALAAEQTRAGQANTALQPYECETHRQISGRPEDVHPICPSIQTTPFKPRRSDHLPGDAAVIICSRRPNSGAVETGFGRVRMITEDFSLESHLDRPHQIRRESPSLRASYLHCHRHSGLLTALFTSQRH